MEKVLKNIRGDRTIWAITAFLAIISFLPIYSASTNLVYVVGKGTTLGHLIKHAALLVSGFVIMYITHKTPYRRFRGLSVIMLPAVILLLLYTLAQSVTIEGANASRWIQIPFVGVGLQPSTLAGVVLMIYVARYLARMKDTPFGFKASILPLWLPVFCTLALILPANFSTTALIFSMVLLLMFLGGYPLKYLAAIIGLGIVILTFFILVAKAFPGLFPNRVDTWISRIEHFADGDVREGYQTGKAKIAIATGGIKGKGPGKSVQKNFLPQSSSDFIYAIIVEEWGLIGAGVLLFLYLLFLFRIVRIATQSKTVFGSLLAVGVGFPIVVQAFVNMAVAVALFPVTGQTLPLISSGGTSIWMTCFAIGVLLSVSSSLKDGESSLDKAEATDAMEITDHKLSVNE